MRILTMATICLMTASAMASGFVPVPPGRYAGNGTWSDNLNGSGTVAMTSEITEAIDGIVTAFTANFSDGKAYAGTVRLVFGTSSRYEYFAKAGQVDVLVGSGVSTPTSFYTRQLRVSPTEDFSEMSVYSAAEGWHRRGTITDAVTGTTKVIDVVMTSQR